MPLDGEEHEQLADLPLGAALDPAEVAPATERLIETHGATPARLLDGEAVTTLFAARREDLTAVLGAHALEEAVDAFTAPVVGLESPFHCGAPNTRGKPKAMNCT